MAHVNDHVPCKVWPHGKSTGGYGKVWRDGRTLLVHRVAWEDAYGPIPDGLFVCHHCDNRACYEVAHLFIGTPRDNTLDMVAKGRHPELRKTHCIHGHPFDEANTYVYPKGRKCRTCRNEIERRRKAKLKGNA